MRFPISKISFLMGSMALLALSTPASAHILEAGGEGFGAGFGHPFSGLDHLLMMLAVGIWAAQNNRFALWCLPTAFPIAMMVGGLAGMEGLKIPFVESAVAVSVICIGLLIALAVRPSLSSSVGLVIVFALFHGHVHGTELPESASPLLYALGFVLATSILHAIGAGACIALSQPLGIKFVRASGVAIVAAGSVLILG